MKQIKQKLTAAFLSILLLLSSVNSAIALPSFCRHFDRSGAVATMNYGQYYANTKPVVENNKRVSKEIFAAYLPKRRTAPALIKKAERSLRSTFSAPYRAVLKSPAHSLIVASAEYYHWGEAERRADN